MLWSSFYRLKLNCFLITLLLVSDCYRKFSSNSKATISWFRLMIIPLMVSSKNVKVSQERCLGTSIENFTGSSPSEQSMDGAFVMTPYGKNAWSWWDLIIL